MAAAVEADDNAAAAVPVFRTRDGAELSSGRGLPDSSALKRASLNDERLPGGNSTEAFEDWAFLVRRPVLKGMNGFDEKRFSEHWAELEVCWQIRNAGKSIIRATGAEAVLHEPAGGEQDETLLAADRVSGAAGYVGKHEGLVAGLLFRLSCAFSALFSGRIGLFSSILSGNRVDPT
jgi:GT2 family glycosyltransferase